MSKIKLVRVTTVPQSLKILLKGQHHFMSQNGLEIIGVSSKGKELEDVANDENIEVIPLEMSREITPLKDLISLWNMYWLLKKYKPEIVHTHTPKAGIIGMLAAKMAKVPNRLHTVAGLPLTVATGVKRKILHIVEKLTYFCATKVYPNSIGLQNIILENKFTSIKKLKVIANGSSNGIDTKYFNPELFSHEENLSLKQKLNITKADFVFIFVGRIVGDKGINELVTAFDRLANSRENIKLILVGAQEQELDPLEKETLRIMNSNENIISVGFQKDVRPYFAISDALVFPSYREGFPNVVMQAGAMGLPSIVSDINGCNEIISNDINGRIIPVKQEQPLYNEMEYFVENINFISSLKQNARKIIVDNYQREVVWEALLREYKSLENV